MGILATPSIPPKHHVFACFFFLEKQNLLPTQEFDGASRKSMAGAGAVLYEDSTGQAVAMLRQRLGRAGNNQAEAAALLLGMEAAKALGVRRLKVKGDNEVVVRQANGKSRIKDKTQGALLEGVAKVKYSFEVCWWWY